MLENGLGTSADEVVLDLEDAVAAGVKDVARDGVVSHLSSGRWIERLVSVRINAPASPWAHLDVQALAALPEVPTSVVVPKLESAEGTASLWSKAVWSIWPSGRRRLACSPGRKHKTTSGSDPRLGERADALTHPERR
jgi:hypothetical protein